MTDPLDLRARLSLAEERERTRLRKCDAGRKAALKAAALSEFHAAVMASGMTQEQLADQLGCSKQFVHDMIHGRREVQAWVLRGMPRAAKLVIARNYLDEIERDSPPSTGTHG